MSGRRCQRSAIETHHFITYLDAHRDLMATRPIVMTLGKSKHHFEAGDIVMASRAYKQMRA